MVRKQIPRPRHAQYMEHVYAQERRQLTVPVLREYLVERGGIFMLASGERPTFNGSSPDTVMPHSFLNGPATIVRVGDMGHERIYGYITWEKHKRTLIAYRLRDNVEHVLDDPWLDDPYIESLLSIPRSRILKSHTTECGTCGRLVTVVEAKNDEIAAAKLRDLGWSKTVGRGWVCPRHRYRKFQRSHYITMGHKNVQKKPDT